MNDEARDQRQEPTKVERERPQPQRRDNSPEHLYWWVCERVDEFKKHTQPSLRSEAGIEYPNPINNEAGPQENDVDAYQRAQNAADDEENTHGV